MVKRFTLLSLLLALTASVSLTGCMDPMYPGPAAVAGNSVDAGDVDLVSVSHQIADAMVAELRKNHPSFHKRRPILMTTFANLSRLDVSSELGLLMSDQVASRLTQQGFTIVETKMRDQLAIRQNQGEFIMSRDIDKLSQQYQAFAVVVGTYTRSRDTLFLTSRMVNVQDKTVLASVSAKIPMGRSARDLLIETDCCTTLPVVGR